MEDQNKKLEAIMNVFKELSYDEKKAKVISIVEGLWDAEVYNTTIQILKNYNPTEDYISDIYKLVMSAKIEEAEEWKEKEKLDVQKKMQDYMHKLNELSMQQKEKDEEEADELLSNID